MSHADAHPAPAADAAPAPGSSVRFVFPLEWERNDAFGRHTITMTTQMLDPHDPLWGLAVGGPYTFVAIDDVGTNPRLAFYANVDSYSAEPSQLFGDDDEFEGDPNELTMIWHLRCSYVSSNPDNLDRPPTDEETNEWNEHLNRMLPIANPSPGLRGWFIPHNPELLGNDDEDAEDQESAAAVQH